MTRSHRFALIVFCLLSTTAYAGITGTVSGRVTDSDGEPLVGVSVVLVGTMKGDISSRDGRFDIVNVLAGPVVVRFSMRGYDTVIYHITLAADEIRELNVNMAVSGGTVMGPTIVYADKEMVNPIVPGTVHTQDGDFLRKIAIPNAVGAAGRQPGVQVTSDGISMRGNRPYETAIQVDGQLMSDLFGGGTGRAGPTISPSVPSVYALRQSSVKTGGMPAEDGGATAIMNTIANTGSTEKYSALINWRTDVPLLFGKASNGLQAGAPLEDVVDLTFDGPLGLGRSTFSLAIKNTFQNHRNFGLKVFDPWGNDLGEMPNNRTWSRNLLGRVKLELVSGVSLLLGGMYGMVNGERNSWDWMYATDQGTLVDPYGNPVLLNGLPQLNGVLERTAKQSVVQEFSTNAFAQLTHTINASTVYDVRASYNGKTSESGKRKSFGAPNIITGFDMWYPEDNQTISEFSINDSTKALRYMPGSNRILDVFDYARSTAFTEDGYTLLEVSRANPLTGYVEGPADRASTNNPYGLVNYFVARGNEGGVDFRNSKYFQLDGNLTHAFGSDSATGTKHLFRAGFELRLLRLTRHFNASPWAQDPFYDVFGSDYGGNLYFDVTDQRSLSAKTASEAPYTPMTGALYVQDQIMFNGLIFTPGLRLDYLDAASGYRTQLDPFVPFGVDSGFASAKAKLYVSPRVTITYPISQLGRQNISLSYGIYYQAPPFADFYDSFNAFKLIPGQAVGNPNLEMQRTNQYQVSYNHQLNDDLAFTITGYYRDIFNQSSLAFVNVLPYPYYQRVLSDYGSARGLELTFRKRTKDNWGLDLNYTLASTKGTANDAFSTPAIDPVTGLAAYPVNDFPLSFDRRHRVNGVLSLEWGNNEGPTIAGIPFLEHVSVNLSGYWQSGLPYTPSNGSGQAVGNINSARFPSNWNSEIRVMRTIPLDSIIGSGSAIDVYFDATNLLNFTDAISYYTRTGSPDYDGFALNRVPGDFTTTTYFKSVDQTNKATVAPNQYDRVGKRLYNANVDFNSDGKVTPEESYRGYQNYVQTVVSRQANYQYPRQVYFGITLRM